MTDFDVAAVLEQSEIAVSEIRVAVMDRRTGERSDLKTYQFGEGFNEVRARKALDRVGYDLINSEITDTQYGELTLKAIFDAFAMAEGK